MDRLGCNLLVILHALLGYLMFVSPQLFWIYLTDDRNTTEHNRVGRYLISSVGAVHVFFCACFIALSRAKDPTPRKSFLGVYLLFFCLPNIATEFGRSYNKYGVDVLDVPLVFYIGGALLSIAGILFGEEARVPPPPPAEKSD